MSRPLFSSLVWLTGEVVLMRLDDLSASLGVRPELCVSFSDFCSEWQWSMTHTWLASSSCHGEGFVWRLLALPVLAFHTGEPAGFSERRAHMPGLPNSAWKVANHFFLIKDQTPFQMVPFRRCHGRCSSYLSWVLIMLSVLATPSWNE